MPHSSHSSSCSPLITLDGAQQYLARRMTYLAGWVLAGLLLGLGIWWNTPARYEASFVIKMPTANALNEFGVLQPHLIKVVPPAFDAKKLLLKPELFTNATLAACALSDRNADRKALVKSIYATEADYGSSVLVAVRIAGKEVALRCANALIADVMAFANDEKDRFIRYSLQVNPSVSAKVIVNTNASLTAPVRISDAPVSPRPFHLVFGCLLAALVFGLLLDWLRWLFAMRNQANLATKSAAKAH